MSIVDRLQAIVKERGTTFKQLERDVGLGNGTIRRWEEQSPRLDKLTKVADYLQVSLDFLVYGVAFWSRHQVANAGSTLKPKKSARA